MLVLLDVINYVSYSTEQDLQPSVIKNLVQGTRNCWVDPALDFNQGGWGRSSSKEGVNEAQLGQNHSCGGSSMKPAGEDEWDFLNADADKLTFVVAARC